MPDYFQLTDFTAAIPEVLKDDAGKLYPVQDGTATDTLVSVLKPFVLRALERYSKDVPLEVVTDVVAETTQQLPLPAGAAIAEGAGVPVFDANFSNLLAIEYPIGGNPPSLLDASDYAIYRAPSGRKIRLTGLAANTGDTFRIIWTCRHPEDGSTVADSDFYAVVDFAASLAAEQLATAYAQTSDPTIGADIVNYRTKSAEYQSLAKMLRKRYFSHLGIDESDNGQAEVKPALAMGQQSLDMQSGVERLVHTRMTRR